MEAKNIIIGGLALAVVGGGAYFYFKNKSKKPLSQQLADSLSTTAGVPATSDSSTSASTPDKVLDNAPITKADAEKQIQAQGLANQIVSLKNEYDTLQDRPNRPMGCSFDTKKIGVQNFSANNSSLGIYQATQQVIEGCNSNFSQIQKIQKQLSDLGYKEDKGLAVKI
jgi:hypothetical protein